MKSALWLSLALVLVCASAAHATIHETWQIDVSGVLNDVNGGQISINGVVYYGGSFAGGTYEQGLGILGLAHNGAFAGTLTLEVQYKESEYTPGEYQMDYDFYRDGWLITGATISLPTALGGTRTFTADFTNASTDSYRGLGWFNDAGEGTTDYPNAHPEMHEALRFVFPEYNGPGGYSGSCLAFASEYSGSNVWTSLTWHEDVNGDHNLDAISLSMYNITFTPGVIPEPGTMALLALGGLSLMVRRQRA